MLNLVNFISSELTFSNCRKRLVQAIFETLSNVILSKAVVDGNRYTVSPSSQDEMIAGGINSVSDIDSLGIFTLKNSIKPPGRPH